MVEEEHPTPHLRLSRRVKNSLHPPPPALVAPTKAARAPGRTMHSLGGVDVTVCLADEQVTQHSKVLNTDAFDTVIGTDFLRRNSQVKLFSLQRLYALFCDFGSGLFSIPLELSGRRESGLRYVNQSCRSENYKLVSPVLEKWTGRPAGRPE